MTRYTSRTDFPFTHAGPPAQKPPSMAEWQARDRSDRRFHLSLHAYMVAITLAAAAISLGWIDLNSPAGTPDASIASDATAPASINPASPVEARAGQPGAGR